MTVTVDQCTKAIRYLTATGLGRDEILEPVFMADALNYAPATDDPRCRELLNPTDEELARGVRYLASRMAKGFPNAHDIASAIRAIRGMDVSQRRANLAADEQANGPLPSPDIDPDRPEWWEWKRQVAHRIASGTPRAEAMTAAYRTVGITPPPARETITNPARLQKLLTTIPERKPA